MNNTVTREMLLRTAPSVLMNDANMKPIVEVLAETMVNLFGKCSYPVIFPQIDELPESLLDILARDFKVAWYDFNYDIETKRRLIKDSFSVHRCLGTTAAVKRVVADIWPNSHVEEWFEYGGDPFHFQIILSDEWSHETELAVLESVSLYKNARSVLDGVIFVSTTAEISVYTAANVCGIDIEVEAVMM
ncbi:MAG: phage tail protein I [Oscillospiraceae bacterium]|nr:phage tail protein I [Oscillospiraceae bacterium]